MEKKITKREVVEMMLADEVISSNEVYTKYLKNELELLVKKSENKKATKNQLENESLMTVIVDVMSGMAPATATEVLNAVKRVDADKYATLTNQRVSALLKKLVENDTVEKSIDKRVSRFALKNFAE
jgi:response regulator RpfG family c-di-GMP phosphodiesterase